MRRKTMSPVHPGEILREEFLSPLGISQYRLAKETSVPPGGSTRSSEVSGASVPTAHCAWHGTSGRPNAFG